jgi:hypothetical protein
MLLLRREHGLFFAVSALFGTIIFNISGESNDTNLIIRGVTIPGAVFNNQFDHLSERINSPDIRALLVGGHAYEHATKAFVSSLPESLRLEVIGVYSDSLKLVWEVAVAVAGLGFLLVFVEKEVKLRTALNTEFGIKKQGKEVKARPVPETELPE